jgi:outer membrane protein assembly factor BamE (lipoprotein component of BamABCDE complex)
MSKRPHPMNSLQRRLTIFLLAAALAGCASTGNGALATLTQARASEAIVIGKSTKAQVRQAFGEPDVTPFANGYELWLYQLGYAKIVDSLPYVNLVVSSADNKRELSILFDQAGVVKKYLLMDQQP